MALMNVKPGQKRFSYGGQAVIEGVMMRGVHTAAVAVRNPAGEIVVHEQPLNERLYRGRLIKTPFLRGLIGLWDALGLGTRALMWSADVAMGEEEEVNFNGPMGWATVAFSLLIGLGVFFLLPTTIASGLQRALSLQDQPTVVNLFEGLVQLSILITYISLIGLLPDVKRIFRYHGAEHKTINAYEAGAELTPENVEKFPIEHPRCGTAFLLTVVFVGVFFFSLLGRPPFLTLVLSRLVLIPIIAGVSYELLRFTAKHRHHPLIRWLIVPNLALQHLTTRQPELAMIEVAVVAFERVLVSEGLIAAQDARRFAPNPKAVSPTFAIEQS